MHARYVRNSAGLLLFYVFRLRNGVKSCSVVAIVDWTCCHGSVHANESKMEGCLSLCVAWTCGLAHAWATGNVVGYAPLIRVLCLCQ